ncbi:MAG: nucleotidyltransferase domain-containing protein [Spirochaetaceae bacterium]|nr:nucleotidyltransferase domain-containing protein [Spirochaetaceae bacterium]
MSSPTPGMQLTGDERLQRVVDRHPYPLLFVTISGAHLYGFPSPDSDYDLRGVHLLPLKRVIGLDGGGETVETSHHLAGMEIDLVTHDARKFFGLLLKPNGYVLEQVHSPLVVHTTPAHEELKAIAADCVTRRHERHYRGFAAGQWKLFQREQPPRIKPLLYVYRVLLTGIHLMRTGAVEANLRTLNDRARLPCLDELIARKAAGPEQDHLPATDVRLHAAEYERLAGVLRAAADASHLPEQPRAKPALHDLLLRLRLHGLAGALAGS